MPVESATFISQLVPANPTATDPVTQGQQHLTLLKSVLQSTFPNLNGAVTSSPAVLNAFTLTGTTLSTASTLNAPSIKQGGNPLVPSGLICMWSGSIASIPAGWVLCNGSNGTPDLRGQFIMGAGGSYAPGYTGGAASVSLLTANLPAHSHTLTDPGHAHGVTDPGHAHSVVDPGHSHTFTTTVISPSGGNLTTGSLSSVQGQGAGTNTAATGLSVNAATTSIGINAAGTGITVNNTGSNSPVSILPPFYALAFIMKT